MTNIPNMVMVSGSAKKTGKTTLCCRLIEQLAEDFSVIAVKTTSHIHGTTSSCSLLKTGTGYSIYSENEKNNYDSGRMLAAGASQSLYIECAVEAEKNAFEALIKFLPNNQPIVLETAGGFRYLKPALHIYIADSLRMEKNAWLADAADMVISSHNGNISVDEPIAIGFVNNTIKKL